MCKGIQPRQQSPSPLQPTSPKPELELTIIFLGQVRADEVNGKTVSAIEFTAQEEMANAVCHEIREETFAKFDLSCMHIYHSLGESEGWRTLHFRVYFVRSSTAGF